MGIGNVARVLSYLSGSIWSFYQRATTYLSVAKRRELSSSAFSAKQSRAIDRLSERRVSSGMNENIATRLIAWRLSEIDT
jgi:hypothetical protein